MATEDTDVFARLERFFDAVPRDSANAEVIGGLVLFVRNGAGWPFYARPKPDGNPPPSAADITTVRARQRQLGLPEAFEWVHDTTPDLLAVVRSAGLSVLLAPLMVLDPSALPDPERLTDLPVRVVDPAAPTFDADVTARRAVARVAFAAPARTVSEVGVPLAVAGPAERDTVRTTNGDEIADERRRAAAGRIVSAVAEAPPDSVLGGGVLASGVLQRVADVAEIAGVATLPSARRRGLGSAVTAVLARHALASGVDLVFLSAGSDEVARMYARIGFRRIGTACIAEPAAGPG